MQLFISKRNPVVLRKADKTKEEETNLVKNAGHGEQDNSIYTDEEEDHNKYANEKGHSGDEAKPETGMEH